jgi:Ca-activated chloride channel family protein
MNFNHLSYAPWLALFFLAFVFLVLSFERRLFNFVKLYWFFNRSHFSVLSTLLFILGTGGLLLSLLDLRGPEEKVKTPVPKERTIILIDTSASMLAEDVKPNRLGKAVLIAKHFARKAAGQQLSVVAFAEVQKKIVPFTNDLDLIDARLESIKNLRNQYGSSALSLAIQETVQYFRETDDETRGNILVFTDGEETAEGVRLKVPKGINLALVGIGTERGGRIPLDDGRGFRFGYKKAQGRDVVTKLQEKFFKDVIADVDSAKYWIANTYSLPSEEILSFFKVQKAKGDEEQDMVIKPVLVEWILVPSILLLVLSYFFKSIRVFSLSLLLLVAPVWSQEEPELSPELASRLEEFQSGGLSKMQKLKLADDLLKGGAKAEAIALYEENLPFPMDEKLPKEAYLNYGTALLSNDDPAGFKVLEELKSKSDSTPEGEKLSEAINQNVLTYFKKQEEKKKQKEKEKKDQENKDQKDQNQNQNQSGSSWKQEKEKKSGQDQDQKNDDQKGQQKDQDKKDSSDKGDEEKKDDQANNSQDQNSEDNQKPRPKVSAKLKQLMADDRQLQMKMIEMGTRELNKRNSRKSKDW